MTNGAKFLAVLMLGVLGTEHYRSSRGVLEGTERRNVSWFLWFAAMDL